MADFIYQEPFPIQADKTEYRLLTKDYVKVVECDGRKILKVDPKGLELLSKRAYSEKSAANVKSVRNKNPLIFVIFVLLNICRRPTDYLIKRKRR